VETALIAALDEFPATDLAERELAKALNQVKARFIFECASVTDMAHQLGYFATIADYGLPAAFEEKLARVTPESVREAARTVLSPMNRTVGVFRPQGPAEGEEAPAEGGAAPGGGARAFSGTLRAGGGEEPGGGRGALRAPTRTPAGHRGNAERAGSGPVAGLDPRRDVLPNGLVVITQEHRDVPTVVVSLEFRAGAHLDPAGLEGTAHMSAALFREGTARFSGEEIAEAFDFVGADLSAGAGRFTSAIGARMMSRDLGTLLPYIASMAREPAFPESQVEVRRGEMLTAVAEFEEDTRAMAQEGLRKALYGSAHAMARRTLGTRSSIAGIRRAGLEAFHGRHLGPGRATLVLVGDFAADEALRMVTDLFGDWKQPAGAPAGLPDVPSFEGTRRDILPIAGKSQVDMALGFPGIARSDRDYHAFDLVNHVLGRFGMGGRLGAKVREEHGLAYSVYSAFDAGLVPGPFVVRAGVDPSHVKAATEDILAVLREMRDDGPTEAEIARSRRALIRSLPLRLETQAGIGAYLQAAELHGLGLDYVNRYAGIVEAIPMSELKRVASERLTPDAHALVLAGPTDRVVEA
jgi:zinc protease